MMPYKRMVDLGALTADDIVRIAFPSRVTLTKVNCIGPAAFDLDVYSRAFAWAAAKALTYIEDNGSAKCRLILAVEKHELQVGDTITVAGTTVVGYNTTHVVTVIADDYRIETGQAFTVHATGGTIALAIPAAQQPLYEVIPQQAAVASVVRWAGSVPFYNQDSGTHLGNQRFIYVKVSADGDYRVTLGGFSDFD